MKASEISDLLKKNFIKAMEKDGMRGLQLSHAYQDESNNDDLTIILDALVDAFGETLVNGMRIFDMKNKHFKERITDGRK